MYKCKICGDVSEPRQSMTRYTIYRKSKLTNRLEIAQELPVCLQCMDDLESGIPLKELVRELSPPTIYKLPQPSQVEVSRRGRAMN